MMACALASSACVMARCLASASAAALASASIWARSAAWLRGGLRIRARARLRLRLRLRVRVSVKVGPPAVAAAQPLAGRRRVEERGGVYSSHRGQAGAVRWHVEGE